jgi:peptide/nickel transport system permease protein
MQPQTNPNRAWTRALAHTGFVTGMVIVMILIFCAVASVFWSPYPVAEIDIPNKLASLSAQHWLGTDSLGRDIASLLWVGSQNTLLVGLIAVGVGIGVGVPLGLLASAKRGWIEEVIMRFRFHICISRFVVRHSVDSYLWAGLVHQHHSHWHF